MPRVKAMRLRPGKRDESHDRADRPTSLAELARQHGLRCYRDACRDDHIPGRWGEISRYAVGKLGVQVSGPRVNGTATAVPQGSNKRTNAIRRDPRSTPAQLGDGQAVFVVADRLLLETARAIGAFRARKPKPSPQFITAGQGTRFRPGTSRANQPPESPNTAEWVSEAVPGRRAGD